MRNGRFEHRRAEDSCPDGAFSRIEILFEQLGRQSQSVADVVEAESRHIGGEVVGRANIDAQKITNGVVVFGAVQAARGHPARLRFEKRILPGEFILEPARDARGRFGLRMRNAGGRHLSQLEFVDDSFPCLAICLECACGTERRQVEVAGFGRAVVAHAAVFLHKCKNLARLGPERQTKHCQRNRDKKGFPQLKHSAYLIAEHAPVDEDPSAVRYCSAMEASLFCALILAAGPLLAAPASTLKNATGDQMIVNYNIPLWGEGKVPLAHGNGPLDQPFVTVFMPPESKRNGGAVVVAPGGGNIMLMYGAEGMTIAERYNDWGVAAFVLTYRLSPRYREDARVLDAKRAIQLVRARAAEWKLDPTRVGFIGFSAGSSLARSLPAASGPGDPNAADPIDRVNSRPDYLGLVYGPGRPAPGESLKDFPPTFLLCAAGDTGNALGSAQLFQDLTRAGATAEIHVYQKGHHGFGDGFGNGTFSDWMPRLEHFLRQGGFLPGGKP